MSRIFVSGIMWFCCCLLCSVFAVQVSLIGGFARTKTNTAIEQVLPAIGELLGADFPQGKTLVNIYHDLGDPSLFYHLCQREVFKTLTITFTRKMTKIQEGEDPLLTTPRHFQRHSIAGSLNLVILDGENSRDTLYALLVSPLTHPSYDNTLIYQWRSVHHRILFHPHLKNFKYRAEVTHDEENTGLRFHSYCFYCDNGNPEVLQTSHSEKVFQDFTTNFYGKTLRFSTSKRNPVLVNFQHEKDGSWSYYGGVASPVLDTMRRKLNCTITTHPDEGYGTRLPNGSYSGVVGKIAAGKIDIGVMAQHYYRHRVAYLSHLIVTGNVVLSTRSPALSSSFNAIFYAFSIDSWYFLLGLCFGIVLPFYMTLLKLSLKFQKRKTSALNDSRFQSIIRKGLNFIFMPFFEQGLPRSHLPRTFVKIFFAYWLSFVLIVSTAYKSKLRDLMIHGSPEDQPTTFDELANLPHYEVNGRSYGGALTATLQAIQTPTFQNIVSRMKLYDVTEDCIGRVLQNHHAVCIFYREVLELFACRNYTDKSGKKLIQISPESKSAFYLHGCIATRRDAVYKETVDALVHLVYAFYLPQYGLAKDFRQAQSQGRVWARSRDDSDFINSGHDGSTPNPLELKHFKLIFFILFAGLGISGLLHIRDVRRKRFKSKPCRKLI